MLHHAHLDVKGGKPTFAAVNMYACYADETGISSNTQVLWRYVQRQEARFGYQNSRGSWHLIAREVRTGQGRTVPKP